MQPEVHFKTNEPDFSEFVKRYAAAAMLTYEAAFEAQGRELCNRLMKFTPPLSGKSIKSGLWNRDIEHLANYKELLKAESAGDLKKAFEKFSPFRDPDIEDMSAKQVGERRVEKDIRKVLKGVYGAKMPSKDNPIVIVSQTNPRAANHDIQVDWGVRQKCQGKDAIRIYADRSGNVYGVDTEKFLDNPSQGDLARIHNAQRGQRGRVTTAANKDLVTGRWRWLNIAVAPMASVQAYIEKKKRAVGQAKGGWSAGFKMLGGKISERGWIGRWMMAGSIRGWPATTRGVVNISITNNSAWASNGDPDRVMEKAAASRQRDMEKLISIIMTKRWGEGSAKFNPLTGKADL